MPRPRALRPGEVRRTLVGRFSGTRERPGLADRLRQLATRFGLRSKRVYLVWTEFGGAERGEGAERELARLEILPTPKVEDLSGVTLNPYSAGKLPDGAIRVDRISAALTLDELMGVKVPGKPGLPRVVPQDVDFFWEVVPDGDGRGDSPPARHRYRLLSTPTRQEGRIGWSVLLQRSSEDRDRLGRSQIGPDRDVVEMLLRGDGDPN